MTREFKAKIINGKLVIFAQSEEKEYIGEDGKVHKDVIIHAPSLKLISEFKEVENGKRDLRKNESEPNEQGG